MGSHQSNCRQIRGGRVACRGFHAFTERLTAEGQQLILGVAVPPMTNGSENIQHKGSRSVRAVDSPLGRSDNS